MSTIAIPTPARERAIEFGLAALLHVALLLGLSAVLLAPRKPPPPPAAMDVTIADDVGLRPSAPQNETPPAPSRAPDLGAPEDAAPSAPSAEPEPTPAKPRPAQPAPAPRPAEIARPQPFKKVTAAPPQPAKPQARPAPSGSLAAIVGRGGGTTPGAKAVRPRGSSLGSVMSGLGATPSPSHTTTPQGAAMSQTAMMDIGSRIKQQVQPCADRQVNPGPGAEKIRVTIRLRINRDGTLAARPVIEGHDGVDDGNSRYVRQVDDRAIATFMGCQPLRGLPPDLYDVPNGWSSFALRYKLPG